MRVLVVGGTGCVGARVVRLLAASGHEVTVAHRGRTEADLPASVRHLRHPALDAFDPAFLRGAADELRRAAPEVVLQMMAATDADARALMETFRGVAGRVVAVSSADVYRAYGRLHLVEPGPPDPVPLGEDAPLQGQLYPDRRVRPGSPPVDKVLVEREVLGDPALPGTVLRWAMVYGEGDRQHRLHPYLAQMDAGRRAVLLEEGRAGWRASRAYAGNVAAAVALAVTDARAAGRTYNVAEADAPPEAEWVAEVGRAAGWRGRVVAVPREHAPAHLVAARDFGQHWVVDTSRIRAELGYAEDVPRDEALRRTVAWEREHPPPNAPAPDELAGRFRLEDEALRAMAV